MAESTAAADGARGGEAPVSPASRAEGGPSAPPATFFKGKVRWSLDVLSDGKGDKPRRSCCLFDLDTSHVKGDWSEGEGLSGELDESATDTDARVQSQAWEQGQESDVLFPNDVFRQEVSKTAEDFVAGSIPAGEELERDGVVETEAACEGDGPNPGRRQKKKEKVVIDLENMIQDGFARHEARADNEEELSAGATLRASGDVMRFGMSFGSKNNADAICRSLHSPVTMVPGMSEGTLCFCCCAPASARGRRTLASEKKMEAVEGAEGDERADPQAKKSHGARAEDFFKADGCHGMVQARAPPCLRASPDALASRDARVALVL